MEKAVCVILAWKLMHQRSKLWHTFGEFFVCSGTHTWPVMGIESATVKVSFVFFSDPKCLDKSYGGLRLTASVVICFYNEARSVLLRTVTSVLRRSPDHLLREILLVDDASSLGDLKGNLTASLSKLSRKISVLRLKEREGLIRARIAGARRAIGDTLVFMGEYIGRCKNSCVMHSNSLPASGSTIHTW